MSLQELGLPEVPGVQLQSASTVQADEQPSLLLVLPSSQYPAEGIITFPSPQISVHVLAVTESPKVQVHPDSTEQVELHPSLLVVPPSSQ